MFEICLNYHIFNQFIQINRNNERGIRYMRFMATNPNVRSSQNITVRKVSKHSYFWSEYRKVRTVNTPYLDTFHAVYSMPKPISSNHGYSKPFNERFD